MGPRTTCLSRGTNLHLTSCDNPMTWPPKLLFSKMSRNLCYQRCRSSSSPQERWPRRPFVSTDHGQRWESPSVMMRDVIWASLGSRKETQCLLKLLEKENFPPISPSQWGLSPLHSFLGLSLSRGRRGRMALTPGQGKCSPHKPQPGSERWPQPGYQATGKEDQRRAQQQRPPTAGLPRILETHVRWRERKKAAELPRNCC